MKNFFFTLFPGTKQCLTPHFQLSNVTQLVKKKVASSKEGIISCIELSDKLH